MDIQDVVHLHNRILLSIKKEILTDATTGVDLEDIKLSKISQMEKNKYFKIPLT